MTNNRLAGLEPSLRGQLITRGDKEAFDAARCRGFNRDLNVRAKSAGLRHRFGCAGHRDNS